MYVPIQKIIDKRTVPIMNVTKTDGQHRKLVTQGIE